MNRIEEIQSAKEEFVRINGMVLELAGKCGAGLTLKAQEAHGKFMREVDSLLAKLEIAQQALEEVVQTDGDNRVIAVHDVADKALKAIRE